MADRRSVILKNFCAGGGEVPGGGGSWELLGVGDDFGVVDKLLIANDRHGELQRWTEASCKAILEHDMAGRVVSVFT